MWLPYVFLNSVLVIITLVVWVIYYLNKSYSYWSDRGVPYLKPVPFLGNMAPFVFRRKFISIMFAEFYEKLDGHKFGGAYQVTKPLLIIRDPSLVKEVLVKSFSSFHDRMFAPNETVDPLSVNLVQLGGQKWRNIRYKLSAAFSGNKLRAMHEHLIGLLAELHPQLQKLIDTRNGEVEVREMMGNCTMDAIAACAMGLKCYTIRDGDSEFKRIALKMLLVDTRASILNTLVMVCPKVLQFFGLKLTRQDVEDFFLSVTRDALQMKSDGNRKDQKDFLQYIISVREAEVKRLEKAETVLATDEGKLIASSEETEGDNEGPLFTDAVIAANTSIFVVAGYEITASATAFCLYEMALNPEMQDRLHAQTTSLWPNKDEEVPYERLREITYADCLINETLRKYPIAGNILRQCTESFALPNENLFVEKGTNILVSSHGLHNDPKYFPNPEKFDPDRFSEENKDNIVPGSYIPFGDGPRFCIAKRFALLMIKTILVAVISKYRVYPSDKMPKKMEYDPSKFTLSPIGGTWLRFQKRSEPECEVTHL